MKRIISSSILVLTLWTSSQAQIRTFNNRYDSEFANVYALHPEIPKGLLEAVVYNRSGFRNIQEDESESCTGLPRSLGLFGLISDGKGYFNNTLQLISDLSGFSVESLRADEAFQIEAYAKAITSLDVSSWDGPALAERLIRLSELPGRSTVQAFALEIQQFEVLALMNDRKFMSKFGYSTAELNLEEIFGENLAVLSSKMVFMNGEIIYNVSGETFRLGGGIAPCYDYASDGFVQTPSCNYSSRNKMTISAVTIHTIQGTYAGAISWAQNCNASVSYHYVVSNTGQITQMLCESDKGWHVGSENPYTIGIEHDGYVSNANNYTPAMYAATGNLVYDITQSGYGISGVRTAFFPWAATTNYNATNTPGSCVKIKGHQHFPNQSHTDPGQYWDWHHFYKLVNPNTPTTTLTDASGDFYDSGGQIGVYSSDERTLTLIHPTGANTVSITFQSFNLEDEWDYLYIYDGTDVFAPLIGYYTGTDNPGTLISNSGHLLFEFRSDCNTAEPGWEASWNSSGTDNTPPTVDAISNNWETSSFYALYTDVDAQNGSGVNNDERFSSILDFDGTRWSGNPDHGFLFDPFNPGLGQWVSQTGTWNITGGMATQTDEANTNTNLHIPIAQSPSFNYLYSLKLKISGAGANRRAGIHFMCSDGALENRGNSYFVYLRTDNDKVQIYKVTNDIWELETDDDFSVDPNVWYNVKVLFNQLNGEIRVYVNDALASTWIDPNPITTGNSISLRSGNCIADYDDVRVYKNRGGAEYVNIGSSNDPVRYQNPNPNTPACEIRTIIFDNVGNCSLEDVIQVNIDWTAPILSTVNDGQGNDIDQTNDGTQLFANWPSATDSNSGIDHLEASIGNVAGGFNVYPFTNIGQNNSINVPYALVPNDWYYTTIKAINGAGMEQADTTDGQQYIDITVGLEEFMQKSVYPNPTTGIVHLPQIENLKWQLMDAAGRIVAEGNRETQVDLRSLGLAEGSYSIRLTSHHARTVIKLVYLKP